MTSIDHVTIRVSDFEASRAFYDAVLAPLGLASYLGEDFAEWGDFSIAAGEPVTQHLHIAFAASSQEQVHAFYDAAIAAGYTDNGPPGERPHYHHGYYGAYILDPDSNNIEVVFHERTP